MNTSAAPARRGHLKIFFGYAAGVGKTDAMLKAARTARNRGVDVVVGCVQSHGCARTEELLRGLEQLPVLCRQDTGLQELDLDRAIERHPQLLLVDELAHSNSESCRHDNRYQDIRELLLQGIDVYTTLNVQHIESLNDMVASVTGVSFRDRIPDSIFDQADQVEFIDIEPQELLEQMRAGKVRQEEDSVVYTVENLRALRELALRRCADRMNLVNEGGRGDYYTDEHILVCLSPSPTNAKIIRTAARMANAFRGAFTALFVETSDYASMEEEARNQLRANIHLAQQLGAAVETVYGEDIPFQIAEFARLSGVSKIVIGRSSTARRHLFGKPTLTEQLILNAPNLDVHIIPDKSAAEQPPRKRQRELFFGISLEDVVKSVGILAATSGVGYLFQYLGFAEANIITVYVLAVLIISVVTVNRICGSVAAGVSVLIFNFLFTEPKFSFKAYDQGYPVTFIVMFVAAFLTGTLAARLKNSARQSARAAFRTKVLFDANQLMQKAHSEREIVSVVANQLNKLLGKDVVIYLASGDRLSEPKPFPAGEEPVPEEFLSQEEQEVAAWVFENNRHAGATTQTFSNARCLYLAMRVNNAVYGVVGIAAGEDHPIDTFENSILLSMLGEGALALENQKNAREKEEAAILARNEQLKSNLLRTISHDLRTPLTSISGNASNLLSNGSSFDAETKQQLYMDIYDDSMWLIKLVENLLSVTRLEEGQLNLHITEDLVDDVITEALRHVNRKSVEHEIRVEHEDELLFARMDARLIVQVVINIVDNAIKHTPKGSHILISTCRRGNDAVISIADDGGGIPDEMKSRVFEMFFSGANKIADSHRSLGLGLALCRSIISAHGGVITVEDNKPHGTIFTFTLPCGEVHLHAEAIDIGG